MCIVQRYALVAVALVAGISALLRGRAARQGGVVLVHPTCGPTQDDDIAGEVRFQTYERLAAEVNNPRIRWAYLPYSMHMAGPREALQHMIIRKNYGCTHFIIGRDMAGSKSSVTGEDRSPRDRSGGSRASSGWPSMASAGWPKMRAAAGLNRLMRPSMSTLITASLAELITAPSTSPCSRRPSPICPDRKSVG